MYLIQRIYSFLLSWEWCKFVKHFNIQFDFYASLESKKLKSSGLNSKTEKQKFMAGAIENVTHYSALISGYDRQRFVKQKLKTLKYFSYI